MGGVKKVHFSLEQHKYFGDKLHDLRDVLIQLTVEAGQAYPLKDKVHKRISKTLGSLDDLRSSLDDLVFQENRERDSDENARIYYGARENSDRSKKTSGQD